MKRDEKWIAEKKSYWRQFREKYEIDDLEEQKFVKERLKRIPVRKIRSEIQPNFDFSKSLDLKKWAKFKNNSENS